ncbi:MAG: glycosyltransferase family 39 protein [Myxococcota bacterium]|nr:glycosyltransferase family 39 protein [Myxococcota bacterium]
MALASLIRSSLLVTPPLALALFFVITGFRGVNFGRHWDEVGWQIEPVRTMVESGILLPRSYIYPSFGRFLVLLPSIPAAIRAMHGPSVNAQAVQTAMLHAIDAPDYLLRVRRLYIVVSALAVVWVYGAALALGRKPWEAFVAASGLGLSWEYAYHARWVATDCILVQFSAMTLFAMALWYRTHRPGWLYAAAVAVGLGTGTKYPGVVLLVPVVVSSVLVLPARTLLGHVLGLAAVGGVAFAAYLITTPATLLDPFAFFQQLHGISAHYAGTSTHGGYSVTTRWQHYKLVVLYFALAYFSPYPVVAAMLLVSAFVGAVFWIRSEPRAAIPIACFPLAFVVFFSSKYLVVIVRNYLLIVPFLAILAARGVAETLSRLSWRWARWSVGAALAGVLSAEAVWLLRAAESIRHVDPAAEVRQAVAYVGRHARTRFRLSSRVRSTAAQEKLILPANVIDERGADEVVFVAPTEGPDYWHWRTNDPWLTKEVFGPREVDFNWYSTWEGHERIVVMSTDKAKKMGIELAE